MKSIDSSDKKELNSFKVAQEIRDGLNPIGLQDGPINFINRSILLEYGLGQNRVDVIQLRMRDERLDSFLPVLESLIMWGFRVKKFDGKNTRKVIMDGGDKVLELVLAQRASGDSGHVAGVLCDELLKVLFDKDGKAARKARLDDIVKVSSYIIDHKDISIKNKDQK